MCLRLLLVGLTASASAHAIKNADLAPNAPSVVYIQFPKKACTGVVISPGHILTAAHCTNGSDKLIFGDDSTFIPDGAQIDFYNVSPIGSEVLTSMKVDFNSIFPLTYSAATTESPIHFGAPLSSENDLAIIPVGKRMSLASAPPVKVPFALKSGSTTQIELKPCSETFNGTFYGFRQGVRKKASWEITRSGYSPWGNVYRAEFNETATFEEFIPDWELWWNNDYLGPAYNVLLDLDPITEPGDSGGPMFEGDTVCGVISTHTFRGTPTCDAGLKTLHICDPLPPYICIDVTVPVLECHTGMDDRFARFDDAPVSWLEQLRPRLFDTRGLLFGTCPPGTPGPGDDIDSDGDFLPDACDPCPGTFDPFYRYLGEFTTDTTDSDGDGVADVCDNCPAAINPADPNNFQKQPDADNDRMGDACDFCAGRNDLKCCATDDDCGPPAKKCVPIQNDNVGSLSLNVCEPTHKRCASSIDSDGDLAGDLCDNCPKLSVVDQTDSDFDGVGDQCDNCPGKGLFPQGLDHGIDSNNIPSMACDPTADDCASTTKNVDSVCVQDPAPAPLGQGHCSKFEDSDGDGVGDVCDNCKDTPNPPGSEGFEKGDINGQPNCDLLAQTARGEPYPFVGDACNPNPCNRLMKQFDGASFSDNNFKSGSGEHLWFTVSYDPQILPNSSTPSYPATEGPFTSWFTDTPSSAVGMRFCPCVIDGQPSDAWACNLALPPNNCPIDASLYNPDPFSPNPDPWIQIKLAPKPANNVFPSNPAPSYYAPKAELINLPVAAAPGTVPGADPLVDDFGLGSYLSSPFYASWDLTASGASDDLVGYHLRGVMWTAVREVLQVPASASIYQNYSNRYKGMFWGLGKQPPGGQTKAACPFCGLGQCEYCVREICKSCMVSPDAKSLVISPVAEKIFAQSSGGVTDITAEFTLEARSALFDSGARWLTVAERGGWTTLGSLPLAFATLSADATSVTSVLLAESRGVVPYSSEVALTAFAPTSGFGPSPRSDFGAVLSTTENAILVAGGKLTGGELAKDLWMYDIPRARWLELPVSGPAPEKVLAATYLPETHSLWLVDQTDQNPVLARILRYDLRTRTMHQAGKWPRTLIIDRVELSGAPRGNLLLSGSSEQTNHVFGVVIQPKGDGAKGGDLEVVGAFIRKGTLAVEPTLSDTVLTLPLVSGSPTGSDNTVVSARDLLFKPEKKTPSPKGPPPCLEAPCHPPPRLQIGDVL
jgi:Trypsin/Thrombospondin type 3 repeat